MVVLMTVASCCNMDHLTNKSEFSHGQETFVKSKNVCTNSCVIFVELWWINISEFKSESEYLKTIDCFISQWGHSALDGWAAVRCMGKMSLHEIWIRCMRKVGLREIWVVQSLQCVLDSCISIHCGFNFNGYILTELMYMKDIIWIRLTHLDLENIYAF